MVQPHILIPEFPSPPYTTLFGTCYYAHNFINTDEVCTSVLFILLCHQDVVATWIDVVVSFALLYSEAVSHSLTLLPPQVWLWQDNTLHCACCVLCLCNPHLIVHFAEDGNQVCVSITLNDQCGILVQDIIVLFRNKQIAIYSYGPQCLWDMSHLRVTHFSETCSYSQNRKSEVDQSILRWCHLWWL